MESLAARTGNTANTLSAPARTTFNLGARYRFSVRNTRLIARLQLQNALDNYGWNVSVSGGFTYTNPRFLLTQLIADF